MDLTLLGLGVSAFLLGVVHAFDYDHIVEVTDFVSQDPHPRQAVKFAVKFGSGHTATVMALGLTVFIIKLTLAETFTSTWEFFSGIALVALGIWSLYRRLVRKTTRYDRTIFTYGPVVTGLITGLAGTAGVLVFGPIAAAPSLPVAAIFILLYGIGVIGAMSLFGILSSGFFRKAENWGKAGTGIWTFTGLASMILGVVWISRAINVIF